MDFWGQRGQPAIFAAVKAVCDAVGEDLAGELRGHDRSRHAFLTDEISRLKESAAGAEQLQQENQVLRRELDELRKKQSDSARAAARPVLGEISPNTAAANGKSNWEESFDMLAKKYASLEERFGNKQQAARQVKAQRDKWIRYADTLEAKYKKLEKKLKVCGITCEQLVTAAAKSTSPQAAEARDVNLNTSFISNPESTSSRERCQDADERAWASRRAVSTPASTQPQPGATLGTEINDQVGDKSELPTLPRQSDAEQQVVIKQESSDGLVVVSEKSLRKRKNLDDNHETRPPSRKVKSEQNISSDPVITGESISFSPHSSLDLDAGHDGMPTPKKQRPLGYQTAGNVEEERLQEQASDVEVCRALVGLSKSAGLVSKRSPPWAHRNALGDVQTPGRPTSNSSETTLPESKSASLTSKRSLPWAHRNALGDVQTPSRPTSNSSETTLLGATPEAFPHFAGSVGKIAKLQWTLEDGIANLADDGFEPAKSPLTRQNAEPTSLSTHREKLQPLLDHNPIEPDAVVLKPTRPSAEQVFEELDLFALRYEKTRRATEARTPNRAPPVDNASCSLPSLRQSKNKLNQSNLRPIRERPLAELRIEDFKVNPKFNNGYKYAFDEVVRGKADRAELPGCVDPNCCGKKFRAMAQSELDNGGSGVVLRAGNVKMLEDFLGDEAYQLNDMVGEDRQKLWLDAKTHDLATKYGRHRHRFTRKASPPGFWDADFPTTQEIAENKEKSEREERKQIEERWREAKRGGGRWMFRDE
ncbi:DNA repair protein endonuclease SAE2/CtIP C-terminus-domain-containing protein [Lasiosphaeria hispida]|uniref:DNA repair protein endonuclease SAE2/CtIP C-terminus-domain-containing protein n=1 Tax=Lasiosphaeria hispida TaxID=260671 RepID=A0AAJ0MHF0_9PEZI|nr:DNA repair protein endonuclease SAE2/CtIP C-terminus-domain-containing protein [Lasiosphaeria hispida]